MIFLILVTGFKALAKQAGETHEITNHVYYFSIINGVVMNVTQLKKLTVNAIFFEPRRKGRPIKASLIFMTLSSPFPR